MVEAGIVDAAVLPVPALVVVPAVVAADGTLPAGAAVVAAVVVVLPANLTLDDPVTSFGAAKKVVSALRKCGADTVRAVLGK